MGQHEEDKWTMTLLKSSHVRTCSAAKRNICSIDRSGWLNSLVKEEQADIYVCKVYMFIV